MAPTDCAAQSLMYPDTADCGENVVETVGAVEPALVVDLSIAGNVSPTEELAGGRPPNRARSAITGAQREAANLAEVMAGNPTESCHRVRDVSSSISQSFTTPASDLEHSF